MGSVCSEVGNRSLLLRKVGECLHTRLVLGFSCLFRLSLLLLYLNFSGHCFFHLGADIFVRGSLGHTRRVVKITVIGWKLLVSIRRLCCFFTRFRLQADPSIDLKLFPITIITGLLGMLPGGIVGR